MNQKVREVTVYRTLLYLPSIAPVFALSMMLIWLLNPRYGLFNYLLGLLHLPAINWLGDTHWSKLAIVLVAQFGAGQIALIFLAALRTIPSPVAAVYAANPYGFVGSSEDRRGERMANHVPHYSSFDAPGARRSSLSLCAGVNAWNDFLGPLIYLQSDKMYTLSLGLQFFKTMHGIQFNLLMAASCLVVLPVVMVFLFFQRFFIEGITLSSGR